MKNPDKITSIRVHESTKKRLDECGVRGESYEDIILKLVRETMGEEVKE